MVLVGEGSGMFWVFCVGRLRVGRTAVELEVGVENERPLVSLLLMRVATSMEGGWMNDEEVADKG